MYNIDLLENENIEMDDNQAKIIIDEKVVDIALIVTNKRLLILKDINKDIDSYEMLRITKAVTFFPSYEIIFETNLDNIKSVEDNEYKLKDGRVFILISDIIEEYLNIEDV